jgi:hypothetical protein
MRFGSWNVRSLHRTGALKTVARELGKCKLDLVGVLLCTDKSKLKLCFTSFYTKFPELTAHI